MKTQKKFSVKEYLNKLNEKLKKKFNIRNVQ